MCVFREGAFPMSCFPPGLLQDVGAFAPLDGARLMLTCRGGVLATREGFDSASGGSSVSPYLRAALAQQESIVAERALLSQVWRDLSWPMRLSKDAYELFFGQDSHLRMVKVRGLWRETGALYCESVDKLMQLRDAVSAVEMRPLQMARASSQRLTPEQLERIEANKRVAIQKREAKRRRVYA